MLILYANKTRLTVRRRELITSGSVMVCKARFEFSPDWDGMERVAAHVESMAAGIGGEG